MVVVQAEEAQSRVAYYVAVAAVYCLLGVLLLPQGVGLWLGAGLPKLDLPRMAMLALFGLALVYLPFAGRHLNWRVAPRTTIILALIIVWQLISGAISDGGGWSLFWAVANTITYWGFALLFLLLAGGAGTRPMVQSLLTTAAILLAVWAGLEFITQEKLFPYRNLYADDPASLFSVTLRRRVMVDGVEIGPMPLMSLGPFFLNLILGSVLCSLSGFLVVGPEQRRPLWFALGSGLALFSVLATQSRTSLFALSVILAAALYLQRSFRARVSIVSGLMLALTLFVAIYGAEEFTLTFSSGLVSSEAVHGNGSLQSQSSSETVIRSGSVQGRWEGLALLWTLLVASHTWLFGVGPGALFDGNRVQPEMTIYSDQGSFFAFAAESGIVMGLLLAYLLGASLVQGLRSVSPGVRAAALGLGGFWLTALVSIVPHGWTIALVLAGLIESWSRPERAIS